MILRYFFLLFLSVQLIQCGYKTPKIKTLPGAKQEKKILFIAFDGIDYKLMKELQDEGHFSNFQHVAPLTTTFPSATTIGFTGIFQPLDVGIVPGYETRFYSIDQNKIVGGTPFDVYKIPINYKKYFDSFRHKISEKAIMYAFPGVAGKQDLQDTQKLLFESDKNILMTYLGGTDGAQHLLGKNRTKRFMVFTDHFIQKMKSKYKKKFGEDVSIVLFSDHGFHHDKLKMISNGDINKELAQHKLKLSKKIKQSQDVVVVKFGLLSAAVFFTQDENVDSLGNALSQVEGVDLSFWKKGNRIYVKNSEAELAYFEYNLLSQVNQHPKTYRYVSIKGDPLDYDSVLKAGGYQYQDWLTDKTWYELTWNHEYPDVGYRLYDSFYFLVENKANAMISLKPNYQYGSLGAFIGTQLKFGHKGTHGGMFKNTSWGIVMTDDPHFKLPPAMRYDQLFQYFLPHVTKSYRKKTGSEKIDVFFLNSNHSH